MGNVDDSLELRPVPGGELWVLEKLTQDPEATGEYAWFGWNDPGRWQREWAENRLLGADGGVPMMAAGPPPPGVVIWARGAAPEAAYEWEIGIAVLPDARGHGYGTQAQAMLARYLFAHTIANRIEASTETGNTAEQRALEKAGFTREGITRGIGWRDGAWRDGITYSMLRSDLDG